MEPRFARALSTLTELFNKAAIALEVPIRFALIGGLGVSAWGAVRATEDIDLLADSEPSPLRDVKLRGRLQTYLEEKGCVAEWRFGDSDDPVPLLLGLKLPRHAAGVAADVLWAHKRWQREALSRTVALKVSQMEIFVLHPEDLILMKLDAGGPQDLLDVERLLSNAPDQLNLKSLQKKAASLRLGEILDKCLRSVSD
ncbi:MAG TPA: DUF6036 family nucleotidyltransferase [Candidatus Binatia bacterium]|jgi:hypothetical protein